MAVESDSVQPNLKEEAIQMVVLAADRLAVLGTTVNLVNPGSHQLPVPSLYLKHCICTYGLPIRFSALYLPVCVMTMIFLVAG